MSIHIKLNDETKQKFEEYFEQQKAFSEALKRFAPYIKDTMKGLRNLRIGNNLRLPENPAIPSIITKN